MDNDTNQTIIGTDNLGCAYAYTLNPWTGEPDTFFYAPTTDWEVAAMYGERASLLSADDLPVGAEEDDMLAMHADFAAWLWQDMSER